MRSINFDESKTIIQGNPDQIFEFDVNGPLQVNSQILENSGLTGSIFHFVTNVDVLNTVNNETFENVDFEIKAVIQ